MKAARRLSEEATFLREARGIPVSDPVPAVAPDPVPAISPVPVEVATSLYAPALGRGTEGLWEPGRLAVKGVLNPGVARPEGASYHLRFREHLTIRHILAWGQLHIPKLVQLYYPLGSYIDDPVMNAMEISYRRCTHPSLLALVPRRNLRQMDNWELMLVMQLLVRPRDELISLSRSRIRCLLPSPGPPWPCPTSPRLSTFVLRVSWT